MEIKEKENKGIEIYFSEEEIEKKTEMFVQIYFILQNFNFFL